MASNGYLVFDSDTHVGPNMDILGQYLSASETAALDSISKFKRGNRYMIGERKYDRRLGDAEPRAADPNAYMSGLFTGSHKEGRTPARDGDSNPAARVADMDFEGVDVNLLLPSGWFGIWSMPEVDPAIEQSIFRAYHRYMADYCGAFPDRLTGLIMASGRDIESSVEEMKRAAKEQWAVGVFCYAPYGMPLDHPSLEPYWALAEENDLALVIHTFTVMPPYAPGGLDSWDNLFLQRSAAHPWCGMRNMASMIGAGILDRYPNVRLGVLEAGHGWLPAWARRLDEHMHSVSGAIPTLKDNATGYVTGGRYFQSIEMSEGEAITKATIDILGDHVLMYASDYPHAESWYPESVNTVMKWDLPHDVKRKLFWDNAANYYRRYTPSAKVLAGATATAGAAV
jgi:predicted TIM-barrel fold metal-dependent hydrolase